MHVGWSLLSREGERRIERVDNNVLYYVDASN